MKSYPIPPSFLESHLASIVRSTEDAIFGRTTDGIILSWNAAAEKLFGYSADEIVGKHFRILIPFSHAKDVEYFTKVLAGSGLQNYQTRRLRRDGTEIDVSVTVSPILDDQGQLVGVSTIARDITAQKKLEVQQMREVRLVQLLHQIAQSANEATSVGQAMQACLEIVCKYANWPVGHVYVTDERSPGELLPSTLWYFSEPGRFRKFREVTEQTQLRRGTGLPGRVLETSKPLWIVNVKEDKNFPRAAVCEEIEVRAGFAFPVAVGGKVMAVFECFAETPVSPDDHLLQISSYIGAQLGHVIERKHAEMELIRAREGALEASRAKSQFLANMSHEIRTPMTAIVGMADLLMTTSLDESQKDFAATIRKSSHALLTVINDILDFSKIESGKYELYDQDFDPIELVKDTIKALGFGARHKQIGLRFEIQGESKLFDKGQLLRGDSGRIRQVLTNLVGNAIKFTENGEVVVRASLSQQKSGGVELRLEVQDTGIGIPVQARDSIFEVFSQVDSSATRKSGGTGLGLAICKRIVELMGGRIGYDSELGRGSNFWLVVPVELGLGIRDQKESPDHLISFEQPKVAGRVLLVEDNPVNQKVLQRLLEWFGCEVDTAPNGLVALELLQRNPYQLVFMDCHMPELDGYATTRLIRELQDPVLRKVPIIAMTANAIIGEREKCIETGMNDFISKPIETNALAQILSQYLGNGYIEVSSSETDEVEPSSKEDLIDHKILQRLQTLQIKGRRDIFEELLDLYFERTPETLEKMRKALAEGDREQLCREAHLLKSGSVSLGAKGIADACDQIEKAASADGNKSVAELLSRLEIQFSKTRQTLEDQFKKGVERA